MSDPRPRILFSSGAQSWKPVDNGVGSIPSPPLDDELPNFDEAMSTDLVVSPLTQPIRRNSLRLGYATFPPSSSSPTSSIEAEADPASDQDLDDLEWPPSGETFNGSLSVRGASPNDSWSGSVMTGSDSFTELNLQADTFDDTEMEMIPPLIHDDTV